MDSVKDILTQLKTQTPQVKKKKGSQQELFDVDQLATNPKKYLVIEENMYQQNIKDMD